MTKLPKPIVYGKVNGNVFAVIAAASEAMKKGHMSWRGKEMVRRALAAKSYDHALSVLQEYVQFELAPAKENE